MTSVRTLKLIVAYEGAAYVGWQRQPTGASIQGLLEEALARLEGAPVAVTGAGRTDAGVHALGQVAGARVTMAHDPATIQRALNAILPADVRVRSVEEVAASFHARFDARSKRYQYWIWNAPVLPPSVRAFCWHIPHPLNAAAMHEAAASLAGEHDFAVFASSGSDVHTTRRTVFAAGVSVYDAGGAGAPPIADRLTAGAGRFVVFQIEADGFLRHMVRAMTGTLVEVGEGRRAAAGVGALLDGSPRRRGGITAPAHGLVMVSVSYETPCVPSDAPAGLR